MIYLVDANVLSEPTKPAPSRQVVDWLTANEADLCVNAIILGELGVGILALPPGRKRERLNEWFETLQRTVECLSWDASTGQHWAKLVFRLRKRGETMPLLDGMIAATAVEYDLTIATRNTRDFTKAGVKVLNPFD